MNEAEREQSPVALGDRVCIRYRLTLEDGTLVDSSDDEGPLELVLGDGTLSPALEAVVVGIVAGERRLRWLSPEEGFGVPDPSLRHSFGRDEFPGDLRPEPGQVMSFAMAGGDEIPGTVIEVTDERVEVDLNHPLAGRSLCFELELAPREPEAS